MRAIGGKIADLLDTKTEELCLAVFPEEVRITTAAFGSGPADGPRYFDISAISVEDSTVRYDIHIQDDGGGWAISSSAKRVRVVFGGDQPRDVALLDINMDANRARAIIDAAARLLNEGEAVTRVGVVPGLTAPPDSISVMTNNLTDRVPGGRVFRVHESNGRIEVRVVGVWMS